MLGVLLLLFNVFLMPLRLLLFFLYIFFLLPFLYSFLHPFFLFVFFSECVSVLSYSTTTDSGLL